MSPTDYKVFQLDYKAVEYIKKRLQIELQTPLSEFLNSKLDLSQGHIFTLLPEYVGKEKHKLEDFKKGGLLSLDNMQTVSSKDFTAIEVPSTIDGLVEYAFTYLQTTKQNIIVIESILEEPNDESVKNSKFHIKITKKSVYYLLTNKENRETISEIIKKCSSFPEALGIFTTFEAKKSDQSDQNFLQEAFSNIKGLFIEAYDHEGYIIWEKSNGK